MIAYRVQKAIRATFILTHKGLRGLISSISLAWTMAQLRRSNIPGLE